MTDTLRTITTDDEGCWFAGASHRTADALNACVVLSAMHYGWQPEDGEELRTLAETTDACSWVEDPDAGDWLCEAGWAAMTYLDTLAPAGYGFTFDDGFYMLPLCAMEGYDGDADCPHHGGDCPNV